MNLNHVGTKKIETERLILRRFTEKDALDLYNWASNPDICEYIPWNPHSSLNQSKNVISKWIDGYKKINTYNWAIEEKSFNKVIGVILAPRINEETSRVEVGYVLGKPYWSNGYTTEALKAVLHYLFIDVNAKRVEAKCIVDNVGSRKVLIKSGMVYEGILRNYVLQNDNLVNSCIYSALPHDIFNNPKHFYSDSLKRINGKYVDLECTRMLHAVPEKDFVSSYLYDIVPHSLGESVGKLNLKAGFNKRVYYAGNIGYEITKKHRGNNYATEACLTLFVLLKKLGYKYLIITNNPENIASRRVCEKIGANLIRIAEIPSSHELYKIGEKYTCIYVAKL